MMSIFWINVLLDKKLKFWDYFDLKKLRSVGGVQLTLTKSRRIRMKMLKMYRYTILAVFLGVVACSVVPLIAYEGVGLYEIIACKQLLMTDADNDIAIAMTTEQDDYGDCYPFNKRTYFGNWSYYGKKRSPGCRNPKRRGESHS